SSGTRLLQWVFQMLRKSIRKAVRQEHTLGCGVACVAFRCGLTYRKALTLFDRREHAWIRGYFCEELVAALGRAGLDYDYVPFAPDEFPDHRAFLQAEGTIAFVEPSEAYPMGHYLIRHRGRWMNSWLNFPMMLPVEAGFQARIPGKPSYIVFEKPVTVD